MDERPIPLAQGFPPPDRAAWLALVEKTLAGRPLESLAARTADGLTVQPLHEPGSAPVPAVRARPNAERSGWDIRTVVRHPDPARANAEILTDLENGAASVVVHLDPEGAHGVVAASEADLGRALQGVFLDAAPIALDAGFLGPEAADWLAALAKNAPAAPLAFHLDPLSAFAQLGTSAGPIDSHVIAAATTAVRLSRPYPKASLFLASGRVLHEAGGTEAQELAFAAAAGLYYAKALVRAGLPMEAAFEGIVLGLAVDADYFVSIAKLRAARVLWAKLAAACGVSAVARIEARSSGRMLAKVDAWTNLLRLTAAGLAGAAGGADAIVLSPFTEPLGLPDAFARRQARNTQLVILEEAHLGKVADPAAGSGFLDALTDGLAREAWTKMQAIDAAGGLPEALASGLIAREVADAAKARAKAVASRKTGLVGVSEFPDLSGTPVAVEAFDPSPRASPDVRKPGPDSRCPPLTPLRLAEPFERLREAAAAMPAKPKVYLATLGSPSDYAARVTFAQNLFAAGGIEPHVGSAETYRGTKALVVLCSSDALYAQEAEAAARTLKAAGAKRLYLAGRPGEQESALRAAGVDEFVHAGQDAVDVLTRALEALG